MILPSAVIVSFLSLTGLFARCTSASIVTASTSHSSLSPDIASPSLKHLITTELIESRQHVHVDLHRFHNCTQVSPSRMSNATSQGPEASMVNLTTITTTQTEVTCSCTQSATIVTPPTLSGSGNLTFAPSSTVGLSTRMWSTGTSSNWSNPVLTPVASLTSAASAWWTQRRWPLFYRLVMSAVTIMMA